MDDAWHALRARGVGWGDLLDILAVAIFIYYIIRQVRGTPAVQMLLGVIVLMVANALSSFLDMTATHRFLQNLLFYIPFAIIVLFREPIRKLLATLGSAFFTPRGGLDIRHRLARETAIAAFALAHQKFGALILFERTQGLKDYADTGVKLDAELTSSLLSTLFIPAPPCTMAPSSSWTEGWPPRGATCRFRHGSFRPNSEPGTGPRPASAS